MSFVKITTVHPDGREVTGITQQAHVTAQEAFDNRLERLRGRPHSFTSDKSSLTISIDPTDVIEYSQLLEYAETIAAFDNIQPELPKEFLDLMEEPC
ncbi:hypothetical protein [Brevibacterium sp. ZH18]|uniref:hypothetical protein n=1 Tax=Brevibacterium sp. ZH18 TaxID=2927784 RepID=UPI001F6162BD|nr:hypothetical protein [Brevibacterium sp. ZH18]MCI4012350.1 hypothetical protein [Brevibacterium sp. ZH18]